MPLGLQEVEFMTWEWFFKIFLVNPKYGHLHKKQLFDKGYVKMFQWKNNDKYVSILLNDKCLEEAPAI